MACKQKEIYKAESVYKAFYTGGDLFWTENGEDLLCQCDSSIQVLNILEGRVGRVIGEEESNEEDQETDNIICFVLSPDNERVVSAHRSGLLKLWDWKEGKVLKQWRSIHKGPIAKLAISKDSTLLASGGSDSSIRLWDLQYQACTHNLTGFQGVVSVLKIHEADGKVLIFGAGDDTKLIAWNAKTGQPVLSLPGHYSRITGLDFHHGGKYFVSCSRDKVLILWEFDSLKALKVLPLYESAEGLVILPDKIAIPGKDGEVEGGIYVATVGERGVVRFWDVQNAKELYVQENSLINKATEEGGLSITKILFNQTTSAITVASVDHNIIIYDLNTFQHKKQLIGFSDEILDIAYLGPKDAYLAVATNSPDIKFYQVSDMNCSLLKGHTDIVVSLATTPSNLCLFVSGSKDNSVRLWLMKDDGVECVGVGLRHNNSIGDVALSQVSATFMLSGAQDTTLKLWDIPKSFKSGESLNVRQTKIAHEKDINGVCVSPNDQIIATASLDKTAKLWSSDDLTLLGTLRGHKRSVWSCTFSPIDQVLLTTSADSTLKLWSLSDLSCVKTLEGHDSSVLRGHFLSKGTQVISVGGDGLIKLWCIKTSECVSSFDNHSAKIWALAVSQDESHLVSGGCDSKIVVWVDKTEETKLELAAANQEKAMKEQELANLLKSEDLLNALRLALSLERPATVLKIIQEIMKSGKDSLCDTIKSLEETDKQLLLKCASHWNTNSKNCYPAQVVIFSLIEEIASGKVKPPLSVLEALIPYTDRHFKRLTQLLQDLQFIEYTRTLLQPASKSLK